MALSQSANAEEGQEHQDPPVADPELGEEDGAWEESFKGHTDSKPHGPSAVGLDFTFPAAEHVYGIPEHADSFALKLIIIYFTAVFLSPLYTVHGVDRGNFKTCQQSSFCRRSRAMEPSNSAYELLLNTLKVEPAMIEADMINSRNSAKFKFQFFTLTDGTFRMKIDELNPIRIRYEVQDALKGEPLLEKAGSSVGVFWHNAAETWVDVRRKGEESVGGVGGAAGVMSSIMNLVSGKGGSEGAGDGEGEAQAEPSNAGVRFMSESGIIDVFFMMGPAPVDVSRQYAKLTGTLPIPPVMKFSDPVAMIEHEVAKGRKMVAIVDPHIKRDGSYFLHNDAEANNFYVKNKDGKVYEGWCWPGSSSYLDFYDDKVMDYYSNRYLFNNYVGSTEDLHIWNDMNEPSVFNGPEITMPKDCLHDNGKWEHRDVHNTYALMNVKSSMEGMLRRTDRRLRPFLLSRGHYAGTQRYASVWTGDNAAEWGHLKASVSMCLSISIAGIPMCGADIGGFFKYPTPELFARWYQAGAFQPFYRAHSHIDTKRREPWLMGEEALRLVREALRVRYSLLPFWYTLCREHEDTGAPYMRPLWYHYTNEKAAFAIDDQYLLGNSLLVHPVTDAGARDVNVYFPGEGKDIWYDFFTFEKMSDVGNAAIPIPVYLRGGSIIPKKERIRRASSLTHNDPFTLIVALDAQGEASGKLYLDDGKTYDYRDGKYLLINLKFSKNKLSSRVSNENPLFTTKERLERVVFVGMTQNFTKAEVESQEFGKVLVDTHYDDADQVLVVRKPWVNMGAKWTISLSKS
ncbi:hypothetical protein J437_LFUL004634 [Ladona fulva]|uniref:Neutral alpha-glucosidase AB n=1 Tax=Ladona fulva TaxID=123851 RepID=A0A8K0K2R2_LADFU|nr:hypothetical protein J437_LFUL004634 [Ladona fulva]